MVPGLWLATVFKTGESVGEGCFFPFFFISSWNRVVLCGLGWPGACCVDPACLQLTETYLLILVCSFVRLCVAEEGAVRAGPGICVDVRGQFVRVRFPFPRRGFPG